MMRLRSVLQGWLTAEGSTRSASLMRILLGLLLWARFADELLPFRSLEPERLLLSASFFLSTTAMVLGAFSRISTAWAGGTLLVLMLHFGHTRGIGSWTHHHVVVLVMAVVLLATAPCGGSYSLDRVWAVRRAERAGQPVPAERGAVWGLVLVAFLASSVYFWSAFDKTTWSFLSGQRLSVILMATWLGSDYPTWPAFPAVCAALAVATVTLEYTLSLGLFVRRSQPVLVPAGLLLHVIFYVVLPVHPFSLTMATLYLAYLDPGAVHRAIDRFFGARPGAEAVASPVTGTEAAPVQVSRSA